jgi:hypothetical protein
MRTRQKALRSHNSEKDNQPMPHYLQIISNNLILKTFSRAVILEDNPSQNLLVCTHKPKIGTVTIRIRICDLLIFDFLLIGK